MYEIVHVCSACAVACHSALALLPFAALCRVLFRGHVKHVFGCVCVFAVLYSFSHPGARGLSRSSQPCRRHCRSSQLMHKRPPMM
jgi:hypothetical protein